MLDVGVIGKMERRAPASNRFYFSGLDYYIGFGLVTLRGWNLRMKNGCRVEGCQNGGKCFVVPSAGC